MITIPEIIELTATALGNEPAELVTAAKGALLARHVAIYLARHHTSASTPTIASHFNRDHTTILYAVNKVAEQMEHDERMASLVGSLAEAVARRNIADCVAAIDVHALCRRITENTPRAAYRVSTHEIAALAFFGRDLWEIATGAEELARAHARRRALRARADLTGGELEEIDLIEGRIAALGRAITDEMAGLRGPAPEEAQAETEPQKELA